ncbi:MAG: RNA methyltransferase [bacterium]|nr:RNA methyltransferase [bacterium]MDO5462794.1 RNA methyltransferase [bacterium]
MMTEITSLTNPKIKHVVKLRQRSHRDDAKSMLVEGFREIHRALEHHYKPTALFYCEELWLKHENEPAILKACEAVGAHLYKCTKMVFEKIAYRERPDGLLAVGPQVTCSLADLKLPADALILVCESIEKPGNLGTMLRSADASGVSAVIVCDPCTDIHNPNVVRASTGTLFSLPIAVASAKETVQWLHENKIAILAATPHAEKLYFEQNLTQRVALCLGSEQYGLTDIFMNDAGLRVRIPMLGIADSLNVSAAATILLSEVVRQRVVSGQITPPAAEPWHGESTHDH